MIRRTVVTAALVVPLALTPVLSATPGERSDRGPRVERGPLKDTPRAERDTPPREVVRYVLRGTLTADATAQSVPVRVRGANEVMREAIGETKKLTAAIDSATIIRRAHRGKREMGRGGDRRGKRARTHEDLTAGDRVTIAFRAAPGARAATLPPARMIVDHGPPKPVDYRLRGVVVKTPATATATATATSVSIDVRSANRHMRRALDGASPFTAKIGESTRIKLAGRARPDGRRAAGTFGDLAVGDRVIVKLRAPRGLDAEELPVARRIIDIGRAPAPRSD